MVAEISSRVKRTEKKGQLSIWGLVYNEFASMGMDEGVLKLLEMPQELVAQPGVVDVSVLRLGLSFEETTSLVLSVDSPLVAECRRAGVNAKLLWEVIAGENS